MNVVFAPLSFALVILLTLSYEKPIRCFLSKKFGDSPLPEGLEAKAGRRLLKKPFFLIALDMATWLSAAVLSPLILWNKEAGGDLMLRSFFLSFHTGLITTTVAFFVFEFVLQQRLHSVNLALEQTGYPMLSHGIGIDTGQVLAANIGSPDRLSYTLVGDTVNVASRLQELNKEFNTEIILSGDTKARVNGDLPLKELPATRVKGKSESIRIFSLNLVNSSFKSPANSITITA
jgi:Adenylate and Guanylate cyclase catalytic domain